MKAKKIARLEREIAEEKVAIKELVSEGAKNEKRVSVLTAEVEAVKAGASEETPDDSAE
jgi:hypothetical protein